MEAHYNTKGSFSAPLNIFNKTHTKAFPYNILIQIFLTKEKYRQNIYVRIVVLCHFIMCMRKMAPKASVHELHVEGLKFGPTYQKLPQIFGSEGKTAGCGPREEGRDPTLEVSFLPAER